MNLFSKYCLPSENGSTLAGKCYEEAWCAGQQIGNHEIVYLVKHAGKPMTSSRKRVYIILTP